MLQVFTEPQLHYLISELRATFKDVNDVGRPTEGEEKINHVPALLRSIRASPCAAGACVAGALWWLMTQPKLLIREELEDEQELDEGKKEDQGEENTNGPEQAVPSSPPRVLQFEGDDSFQSSRSRSMGRCLSRAITRAPSRAYRPDTTAQQVSTSIWVPTVQVVRPAVQAFGLLLGI